MRRFLAHHTTAEQAGEIFSRVKPGLAVYSHIVPPIATENDLIPPTRKTYSGPLELGEDLMTIVGRRQGRGREARRGRGMIPRSRPHWVTPLTFARRSQGRYGPFVAPDRACVTNCELRRGHLALRATALLFLLAAGPRAAGENSSEHISFNRPEAWALKYFAAVSTFTPLQAPRERAPGAVEALSLEGGWVPDLSESERRVGFEGTKVEDLNRTSVFGRPRILVGLPAGFAVEAGWVPPIEINGAKANILNGAVEKTFFDDARGKFRA